MKTGLKGCRVHFQEVFGKIIFIAINPLDLRQFFDWKFDENWCICSLNTHRKRMVEF